MTCLGRDDDVVPRGITITVVIAAAIGSQEAWQQPLLRLVDTLVAIAVGVVCRWTASSLYYRGIGQPAR